MLRFAVCVVLLAGCLVGKAQDVVDQLRSDLSNHDDRDSTYVNILNQLSFVLSRTDPKESKKHADEAMQLATELGYDKGIAFAGRNLGLYYLLQGNYPLASERIYSALASFEDQHNNPGIVTCLIDLASIYRLQNEWDKANQNVKKAFQLAQQYHFENEVDRALLCQGALLGDQRKYKESFEFLFKVLARIDTAKDQSPVSLVPDILTGIAVAHHALGNTRTGIRYQFLGLAAAHRRHNFYSESNTCVNIGRFLIAGDTMDVVNGRKYLERGLALANQLNAKRTILLAYFGFLEWKMIVGDNAAAHEYQIKYAALKDSMINVAKAIQIAEIEGRYENQRKERELQQLQSAEKESNVQKILLLGALMIGVSIASIATWQQWKTKEKIKKLMDESNQPQAAKLVIVPAPQKVASLDEKFLSDVVAIIETNIKDPEFDVAAMSEQLGMSRAQLQRKLKSLSASSPAELIKDYRLNRAAELIRQKADTITQVGYSVGFNDPSYFTKCFKKKFGLSPSAYLERIESSKDSQGV